ncbi:MAG TPA: ATP-binding protein [Solirubrobacteraceae bacterium]|nr:ATP-binding protein [Solirubrobacteraceae bacterium]
MARSEPTNPFRFGAVARDDAFTDRETEIRELVADARNGQDVVIFAPRRYGKTSLVDRVAQRLVTRRVLVGQINLMRAPTKERLAEKLAAVVHEDFAGPLARARDAGARLFRGLRISPTMTVDATDGSLGFSFGAGHAPEDVDATLERLFEMVAELAAERGRRGVLVLDEFQEVMEIDPGLPKLMRSVFQDQPEVAHVYLGSRRHMMERIFNDENEPFWRSAKKTEIDVIPPAEFTPFIAERFEATGRSAPPATVEAALAITHGHPYATQELCYFLWEETPRRSAATTVRLDTALEKVLQSEHAHFSIVWQRASSAQKLLLQALAEQPGHPLSEEYRVRHDLRSASSVQKALDALEREELIGRERGRAWIAEPFLAEWIRRNAR